MKFNAFCSFAIYTSLACFSLGIAPLAVSGEPVDRSKHATYRFGMQFSESGAFDCLSGRKKLGLGLGVLPYEAKLPNDMPKYLLEAQFGVEIETYPTPKTNHIDRLWGPATFSDGDKKMSVKLNNNKTAFFERFGPTPDWPFKSKKDSQFFFTFRLDDGPIYKCKAVYQPDQ